MVSPDIPVGCDECIGYTAFGAWYYQGWLLGLDGENAVPVDIEKAPLYREVDNWDASYGDQFSPITVNATLEPFEGLNALRYIPVPVKKTARLPVAAARYRIRIESEGTPAANTNVGALFWITAIYDPTVFDVQYGGWLFGVSVL